MNRLFNRWIIEKWKAFSRESVQSCLFRRRTVSLRVAMATPLDFRFSSSFMLYIVIFSRFFFSFLLLDCILRPNCFVTVNLRALSSNVTAEKQLYFHIVYMYISRCWIRVMSDRSALSQMRRKHSNFNRSFNTFFKNIVVYVKNLSVIVCLCDLHVREGRSVLSKVSSVLIASVSGRGPSWSLCSTKESYSRIKRSVRKLIFYRRGKT